ncbi:MAG: hypothetical protein U1E23_02115 [Reyranellaceae bacterium]
MNSRLLAAATAAFALLAACDSPGQLAQKPAAWTATYRVPYDVFAECIAQHERLPWTKVTPSIDSSTRRATVSVAAATGSALGFYDIRSAGNGTIDVSYSSIYGGPGSTAGGDALDKANRCGNAR